MFKHVILRPGHYECSSCAEPTPNGVLLHIPSVTVTVLVIICQKCLEELAALIDAAKHPEPTFTVFRLHDGQGNPLDVIRP